MRKYAFLLSFIVAACATPLNANEPSEPRVLDFDAFEPFAPTIVDTIPSSTPIKPKLSIVVPRVIPQVVYKIATYANPKRAAKRYALKRLGEKQFSCLEPLWKNESGWNYLNLNESSGAYGIPQALPGKKMSSIDSDWRTNPITQVKWGIRYVNHRYGSSCSAWRFWQNNHWY